MEADDKKLRLIGALLEEQQIMPIHDRVEHTIVISYLKNGRTEYSPDDWPLLDAAMNDYQQLLSDYKVI